MPRDHCTMGVGCDEAGVCYAAAHGEPERCPREETQVTDSVAWKLRMLSREVDMLGHAIYLHRNERLFNLVRDARIYNIFGEESWQSAKRS